MKPTSLIAAVLATSIVAPGVALAQDFPTKPIEWISPWSPGGGNDTLSRTIAAEITETLGQPVVVENKPGATGVIGTDYVAKSDPDGYTVTLGAPGTHATAAAMYPDLSYDPVKDFTPITLVGTIPNVLVVPKDLPVENVDELIAYVQEHPNDVAFSSVGLGSMQHLSGELFKETAGVDILHVPYKGSAPALTDLMAGRVQLAFESLATVLPYVKSGDLKALAVTTQDRSSLMPDVPTMAEEGLDGFDVTIWYAVFGPAGIPEDRVAVLNEAINGALQTAEVKERLAMMGADVAGSTPEELATFQAAQTEKWTDFIKRHEITRD